jgi:hypothetical protein
MWLNDMSSDEERQRLLPYVTRLACADTPEIEKKRAAYIAKHTRSYWYIPSIDKALEVLDEALAIGRQADLLPNDEVQVRFEAARAQAPVVVQTAEVEAPEPIPTSSVFTKVKSWFSMKETA